MAAPIGGSVYAYNLNSPTPHIPTILNNPEPDLGDFFGNAVAISGTRVVVGAENDFSGANASGSAYVYDLSSNSPSQPIVSLTNPTPGVIDRFGSSVAISGTQLVVGEPYGNSNLFEPGRAYVFNLLSPTPTIPTVTLTPLNADIRDTFGYSVAISGDLVVVGGGVESRNGMRQGIVCVYNLSSGTPLTPVATLDNPDIFNSEIHDDSVAISGSRVVLGTQYSNQGETHTGRAILYDINSETPAVPVTTFDNPHPLYYDRFGASVAIDGSTVVAGAPYDDMVATDRGAAYVFEINSTLAPPVGRATVTTTAPSSVTSNSAEIGGDVTATGSAAVTERGVVYAATQNPTTGTGTKIISGNGTGTYTVSLTGLAARTNYYVRAYAVNSIGTAYSMQIGFATKSDEAPTVGGSEWYATRANDVYSYFSGQGDERSALAYWFYFRAFSDQARHTSEGNVALADKEFYQGLAFFYYTIMEGQVGRL